MVTSTALLQGYGGGGNTAEYCEKTEYGSGGGQASRFYYAP